MPEIKTLVALPATFRKAQTWMSVFTDKAQKHRSALNVHMQSTVQARLGRLIAYLLALFFNGNDGVAPLFQVSLNGMQRQQGCLPLFQGFAGSLDQTQPSSCLECANQPHGVWILQCCQRAMRRTPKYKFHQQTALMHACVVVTAWQPAHRR